MPCTLHSQPAARVTTERGKILLPIINTWLRNVKNAAVVGGNAIAGNTLQPGNTLGMQSPLLGHGLGQGPRGDGAAPYARVAVLRAGECTLDAAAAAVGGDNAFFHFKTARVPHSRRSCPPTAMRARPGGQPGVPGVVGRVQRREHPPTVVKQFQTHRLV